MRPRDQVYKNTKYEKFIAAKSCVVPRCGKGPIQKHHVYHARKNPFMLVPLCMEHHMPGFPKSYHQLEIVRFEAEHGINLDWIIQLQLMEYIDNQKG